MKNKIVRSVVMGILCFPVGIVVGLYISNGHSDDGWNNFYIYSGCASFVAPSLLWYLVVERHQPRKLYRSALVGTLGAVLAHYFTWYFQIAFMRIFYLLTGEPVSSLGEPTLDLIQGLWGALVFSAFSLVSLGWLTLPAGFAIGYIYEMVLRHRNTAL